MRDLKKSEKAIFDAMLTLGIEDLSWGNDEVPSLGKHIVETVTNGVEQTKQYEAVIRLWFPGELSDNDDATFDSYCVTADDQGTRLFKKLGIAEDDYISSDPMDDGKEAVKVFFRYLLTIEQAIEENLIS